MFRWRILRKSRHSSWIDELWERETNDWVSSGNQYEFTVEWSRWKRLIKDKLMKHNIQFLEWEKSYLHLNFLWSTKIGIDST